MNHDVIAIAFACEPGRGSEPGVGFRFVEALAEYALQTGTQVTVFTRPHKIGKIVEALPKASAEYIAIEPVSIPRWLVHITGRRFVRIAYVVWQLKTVLQIRRSYCDKQERRLIVHHVTFATEALPTFEWLLPRRALRIFGPAGSSQVLNEQRSAALSAKMRGLLRRTITRMNLRGVRLIIAQNEHAAKGFRSVTRGEVMVEPNILLSGEFDDTNCEARAPKSGLISMGLLTSLKRTEMVIHCLSRLRSRRPDLELTIVGDGPCRTRLEALVAELGLGDRVTFTGMVPRVEALEFVRRAQVLVHPSRQEGSAWVVGEAQSVGTIPVAFWGSGADSIIELGSMGVIAPENNLDDLCVAVEEALDSPRQTPSRRWNVSRLPGLLSEWYSSVLASEG